MNGEFVDRGVVCKSKTCNIYRSGSAPRYTYSCATCGRDWTNKAGDPSHEMHVALPAYKACPTCGGPARECNGTMVYDDDLEWYTCSACRSHKEDHLIAQGYEVLWYKDSERTDLAEIIPPLWGQR